MIGAPKLVVSIRDWDAGVTVRITYTSRRYSVTMLDNDSGNILPVARIYSRMLDAVTYASSLVRA